MDKNQTIHAFWSSFGLKAYEENAVPTGRDAPPFPYITYTAPTDSFGYDVLITASVWYRDSSWQDVVRKVQEISETVGYGGVVVGFDGGRIWLRRGHPFSNRMGDPSDDQIKRINLNLDAEFISAE